ncbi:hypothetical protein PR048_024451 [Dryococelus australis]|uniref:Uncharacterized protein n=1 Tax=Dryococelus australis TaxID=614101 RepID=A0ABQ9GNR1_9NEOP|nr:hypothetical protein PR048_024451 [Dryococelus australis]
MRVKRDKYGAAAECKSGGKRENLGKTRQAKSASVTFTTCQNLGYHARNRAQFAYRVSPPGRRFVYSSVFEGTTVSERLDCWPPTTAKWVQFPGPGHSRIFASGNSAGRCSWSADFLWDLPFPPSLHSSSAPFSPHLSLIGSQGLVNSRPNFSTQLNSRIFSVIEQSSNFFDTCLWKTIAEPLLLVSPLPSANNVTLILLSGSCALCRISLFILKMSTKCFWSSVLAWSMEAGALGSNFLRRLTTACDLYSAVVRAQVLVVKHLHTVSEELLCVETK